MADEGVARAEGQDCLFSFSDPLLDMYAITTNDDNKVASIGCSFASLYDRCWPVAPSCTAQSDAAMRCGAAIQQKVPDPAAARTRGVNGRITG